MTFFNPKEEVLDIQLTQYGKYLLSLGKWKPVYYAFFDNDILYDGESGDINEVQNDIEPRIQENTPRLRTQYSFTSRETDFAQYYEARWRDSSLSELERIKMQSTPEKLYSLTAPLGSADLSFNKAPRFKLQLYTGEISGSLNVSTGSFQQLKIPQIDMEIQYKTEVKSLIDDATPEEVTNGVVDPNLQAEGLNLGVFSDGTFIAVTPANILLTLEEENTIFDRENFEIEVFKIENEIDRITKKSKEVLTPLSFLLEESAIKNNLLQTLDGPSPIYTPDSSFVEYYFNLYVDHEIDEAEICQGVNRLKSQGIYVDEELNCPEIVITPTKKDLYGRSGQFDAQVCDTDPVDQKPRAKFIKNN